MVEERTKSRRVIFQAHIQAVNHKAQQHRVYVMKRP